MPIFIVTILDPDAVAQYAVFSSQTTARAAINKFANAPVADDYDEDDYENSGDFKIDDYEFSWRIDETNGLDDDRFIESGRE